MIPNTIVPVRARIVPATERLVFKIIHAQFLAPGIKRFVIEAPRIARKQNPGQFVILRIYEEGERIPVTIENSDPEKGTINIVCNRRERRPIC